MNQLQMILKSDLTRYGVKNFSPYLLVKNIILDPGIRFIVFFRMGQYYHKYNKNFRCLLVKMLLRLNIVSKSSEISVSTEIGPGLYIGHFNGILINPAAKLGSNINVHKGVTIGQENRGDRKGAPIIGNKVWIGMNSIIVGNITIGDNVLIAPNSFVNSDIPPNSIVFGNPARIKYNPQATENYINNIYYEYI